MESHIGHDHGLSHAPERSLRWALGLTGTLLVVEAVGGWLTNSLALLSDAAHMMTDTAALTIALLAIHLGKRPADARRTFGYARFEILAAAFNAAALFFVAVYIFVEAIDRFIHPATVLASQTMIIATAGLIINLISMRILHSASEISLNVKGAYLEVWSDMLGSVGVLAGGAVMAYTGWYYLDPIIAVGIALWVLPRTWILLKESFNILLEGVPAGLNTIEIEEAIRRVPGVTGVHDLHVWAVTSGKLLLTAHVETDKAKSGFEDGAVLSAVRKMLLNELHIGHSTLQIESAECDFSECSHESAHFHGEAH